MKNKHFTMADFGKKRTADLKHLRTHYPLSIFLVFAFFNALSAQPKVDLHLPGLVVMQNSSYRTGKVAYVSGAFVRAPVSAPTMSDNDGKFTLVFSDKPMGDVVNVSVRKTGLEVVNRKDLENAAVIGRLSPLKIVMSKPEELENNRDAYYEINRTRANQIYEYRIFALKKESKTRQRIMDSLSIEYNHKITTLEEAQQLLVQQRDQLQKQAFELAEKFAIVNLDDESETYQRAFKLFTEGAVEKAVQILDSLNLPKRLADNAAIVEKSSNIIVNAKSIIIEAESKRDKAANQIQEDIQSSLLNARLHRSLFHFSEANKNFVSVVKYDSLNMGYLNEYTQFLWDYGEYHLALDVNNRAMRLARMRLQSGDSLGVRHELAYTLYYRQLLMKVDGKNDSLKLAAAEAIPLFQSMVEQDSAHLFVLVRIVAELAQAYWMNDDEESVRLYKQALHLLPQNVSSRYENTFLFNKSFILGGLGGGYQDRKQLDTALMYCQEAVIVGRKLLQIDTFSFSIQLAKMLNNMAAVFEDSSEFETAIDVLNEAVTCIDFVAPMKPKESNREIARLKLSLFYNYLQLENYDEAENQLNQVQTIAENERLQGENNPQLLDGVWKYRRRFVIVLLGEHQLLKALTNAEKVNQLLPSDNRTKALLGATLIFNNQYDKALRTFNTITDTDEINKMLLFFEKYELKHNDFVRIRTYFGLH